MKAILFVKRASALEIKSFNVGNFAGENVRFNNFVSIG